MLLWHDGFDHLNGTSVDQKYDGDNWSVGSSIVRTGAGSLQLNGGGWFAVKTLTGSIAPGDNKCVIGIAFYFPEALNATAPILQVREGATVHMAVYITPTGALQIRRGSTLITTATTHFVSAHSWVHIALKTVIHDSTGSYEVRVDNDPVPDLTASGVDTQNGGTATWNTFAVLGGLSGSSINHADDLYVCDGTGSGPDNDFLGLPRVITRVAVADSIAAGTYGDFTPSSGGDNGAMVDEANTDADTTYNLGTTPGQKDTYKFAALANSNTIYGVQVSMHVRKTDAGVRTIRSVVRSAGNNYFGASQAPLTTFRVLTEMHREDPDTADPWIEAGVDALEAGMELET